MIHRAIGLQPEVLPKIRTSAVCTYPVPKGLHFIYPLLNRGVTAAVVRSGDCRAGKELTIQRARSRNFSMAGQPTTSQILKLTPQIDAACLPET